MPYTILNCNQIGGLHVRVIFIKILDFNEICDTK